MAISKIGNLILAVSDLERSLRFYRDILGLKVVRTIPGDFVFLDGGGVTLALRQAPGIGSGQCRDELSFETDDVRAVYAELQSKGVSFTRPPRAVTGDGRGDLYAADFRDPDSHILSITGWVPNEGAPAGGEPDAGR
jgi:catechol 2,3-dioxygenase-like lactoylglutathione lyase family enzyme